ncbi:hypothetical protein [Singulisphaera acidiphila]|uniref:Transglutaminase-like superfamily protein n=1 Tax=Singulisphaera acidiphila (strain ATCC BAA-1392 / DSM 18658 / VKM B-2454 / MOB10) TaxID=886293 RepID=L0DQP5_SINAD|nr:hypothetical protein [Singulisphaera acidiphila]AGA31270.1 hypothetical protein Sinac_7222 [Singulisphaera acidiphila DSM 18658]
MKWRLSLLAVLTCLASTWAGCDYSTTELPPAANSSIATNTEGEQVASSSESSFNDMKPTILESVISLIQTAALKPGGDNFKLAVLKLNTYFEDIPRSQFALEPTVRDYLKAAKLPEQVMAGFERTTFEMPDSRHLEDCMLYHGIATRIGGNGDDLTRVRRVFDWMVRQVQLAPAGTLAAPGLPQAQVRPYDMLLRGMATEADGGWSERGWLFMSLCRQLGVDVALLTYQPKDVEVPNTWICAALIDGKLYLFDPRLGIEIPGPGGKGVATLDEALADPEVLGRLNVPGAPAYRPSHELLAASTTKIGALLDSSPGYYAPRMLLLEKSLPGKYQTVLYRDPVDESKKFTKALGARAGEVTPWPLPLMVETMLFTSGEFVQATQHALFLFRPEFPLLYARIKQLRGELPEAVSDYMTFRFVERPLLMDRKTPMPQEVQQALDMYSTYFLGLAHLEQDDLGKDKKHLERAELFFKATLKDLPAPGPRQPYYHMFRWGAQSNLGRLNEAQGDLESAVAYYSEADPTAQHQGNLLRARDLILNDPFSPLPAPLSSAPASTPNAPPEFLKRSEAN